MGTFPLLGDSVRLSLCIERVSSLEFSQALNVAPRPAFMTDLGGVSMCCYFSNIWKEMVMVFHMQRKSCRGYQIANVALLDAGEGILNG
jgi:hypothetical protein